MSKKSRKKQATRGSDAGATRRGHKAGKRDGVDNVVSASEAASWPENEEATLVITDDDEDAAPYSKPAPKSVRDVKTPPQGVALSDLVQHARQTFAERMAESGSVKDATAKPARRRTVVDIRKMKGVEQIACLTAYDYPTAAIVDESGIDVVLVGDSLGNVVLGHEDTLSVTMDHMVHHTRAVAGGLARALLVGDMPFLSYHVSVKQAVRNAGRLVSEGRAQCVKLEGGASMAKTVRRIVEAGIPVMGHIGLTPQAVHTMGGYRMQGKSDEDKNRILDDALALQDAGCFSIVLECVYPELTERVTKALAVPTIGIGSGDGCDGQILVVHDMLGYTVRPVPKFVTRRADLRNVMGAAIREYVTVVKKR